MSERLVAEMLNRLQQGPVVDSVPAPVAAPPAADERPQKSDEDALEEELNRTARARGLSLEALNQGPTRFPVPRWCVVYHVSGARTDRGVRSAQTEYVHVPRALAAFVVVFLFIAFFLPLVAYDVTVLHAGLTCLMSHSVAEGSCVTPFGSTPPASLLSTAVGALGLAALVASIAGVGKFVVWLRVFVVRRDGLRTLAEDVRCLASEYGVDPELLAHVMLSTAFSSRNPITLRDMRARALQWVRGNRKSWLSDEVRVMTQITRCVALCALQTPVERGVMEYLEDTSEFDGLLRADMFARRGKISDDAALPAE